MKHINIFTFVLLLGIFSNYLPAQGFGFGPANTTIPDAGCGTNELVVTATATEVGKLDFTNGKNLGYVLLNINHSYVGDLEISLTSPEGTTITLSTDNGGSGDNYTNTSFASWAPTAITSASPPFSGYYRPEQSMNAFDGEWADGDWTLTICDDAGGDVGTFVSASIWFAFQNDLTKVISLDFFNGNSNNFGHGLSSLNTNSGSLVNDFHGRFAQAFELNGNNYAQFNSDNGWLNPTQGISMGAWIKPASTSGAQMILGKSSNLSNFYTMGIENGELFSEVSVGGAYYTVDGGNIEAGKWQHVSMVYAPNGLFIIYINGNQVNSIAAGSAMLNSLQGTGNWIFGAAPYNTNNARYQGVMDGISVWNYAVNPATLRNDMAAYNNHCLTSRYLPASGTSCGQSRASHNYGATASQVSPSPSCANYQQGDVWFHFEVPNSGSVTVETDGWSSQNSFSDAGMEIYSGDCDNLVALDCDDDDGTGNHSMITLTGRTPGEILKVRVWEYGNDVKGFFTICAYDPNIVALDEELDEGSVRIYPNPTAGPVHLSWTADQFPAVVTVFDLSGRVVSEESIEGGQGIINLEAMAKGAYLIRVVVGNETTFHKIIRNRM